MTTLKNSTNDRIFIGVYPGGIVYADRHKEERGDYARLAFLSFKSLTLTFSPTCPTSLIAEIMANARQLQRRAGERYPIDQSGHTVVLGGG